ncbi:divalent-cation tolerance protein CutA [Pseudemcibacter aquimaris]|nr:divalent-cation tolerance protein CutA [Pseudemcibacter aquimaris]
MFLKTIASKSDAVTQKIKSIHSYDVPCIVMWNIVDGNQDYLNWIDRQIT